MLRRTIYAILACVGLLLAATPAHARELRSEAWLTSAQVQAASPAAGGDQQRGVVRVYDPGAARFLQTDPVGYEPDLNLYAYVLNDPLNRADPMGTEDVGLIMMNEEDRRIRDQMSPAGQRQFNETQVKVGAATLAVIAAAPVAGALLPEAGGALLPEGGETVVGGALRQSLMNTTGQEAVLSASPEATLPSAMPAATETTVTVPGSVNVAETTATVGGDAMATAAQEHGALNTTRALAQTQRLNPPASPQTGGSRALNFVARVLDLIRRAGGGPAP